jgi:hypothetical protein
LLHLSLFDIAYVILLRAFFYILWIINMNFMDYFKTLN